jgi:phosphoglucosamine mutase
MTFSYFGTDGIRGETSLEHLDEEDAILALTEHRTLHPSLMRVLGEALSHVQSLFPGNGQTVVVGWDDRPHNEAIVEALTLGLQLSGSEVIHIGLCATPTLHAAVLHNNARMGCMITASHNPVSDSGIKVFDAHGFKTTPLQEQEISRTLFALASEEREVNLDEKKRLSKPALRMAHNWAETFHQTWLERRWADFEGVFGGCSASVQNGRIASPFYLDCAHGAGASWLANFLTMRGIETREVSENAIALNANCGAGDFSPTQTWTVEEAASSPHALLSSLNSAEAGTLVGAALDGDGDRCLLIEATDGGYKVIDGDAMAAMLIEAGQEQGAWRFAASIESDVALTGFVSQFHPDTICLETAVGDRWLSVGLRHPDGLIHSDSMPLRLGVEDSGHLVMPASHSGHGGKWSLVGDGAASLCAFLLAQDRSNPRSFNRGWKRRTSVKESHRERWQRGNELQATVSEKILTALKHNGIEAVTRTIEGEENLLLVHGEGLKGTLSFGIRNSGTQAKTSLSLRLSPELSSEKFLPLLEDIEGLLSKALQ